MNTPEAAAYTGLGKSTLDRFRLVGGGPPFSKVCGRRGRVIYDPDDLDAWLEANKRRPMSKAPACAKASPAPAP
jgi:hypothetical protein